VQRGEISESRINESVRRILRAKAALGLLERRTVDINSVDRVVSDPQFNSLAQEIANRSITLVRDNNKSIPLGKSHVLNVAFTGEDKGAAAAPFVEELRRLGTDVESIVIDNRSSESDLERVRMRLLESDGPVVYSVFVVGPLPPTGLRLAEEIGKVPSAIMIS